MSCPDPIERSLGCLYGGAMGDAFGYHIEFLSLPNIKARFGEDCLLEPIPDRDRYLISDDTQMTLLTADGILFAYTRYNERGIADSPYQYVFRKYRKWAQLQGYELKGDRALGSWLFDDPAMYSRRAPGITCLESICGSDMPATVDSPVNNSKGCGGLMRVAPVGLFCAALDPRKTVQWATEIAASTHGHPLGYMTAGLMAEMICHISRGKELVQSIDGSVEVCREYYQSPYFESLAEDIGRAIDLSSSDRTDAECMAELGEGWVAEETLSMAILACLRHQDDFKECLKSAVNVTGDSDSIGSVAGNILGTYLGIEAVRESFDLERLECYEKIGIIAEDLVSPFGDDDHIWSTKYTLCKDPYTRSDSSFLRQSICKFLIPAPGLPVHVRDQMPPMRQNVPDRRVRLR